jgi:hypothetical protein
VLCAAGAYAAPVAFNVSGTFVDGTALSGTITIDTAAGTVTAVNVTLGSPDANTYTVIQTGVGSGAPSYYSIPLGTAASPQGLPSLNLLIPPRTTLVGYAGGALCSDSAPCSGVTSGVWLGVGNAVALTSGSLSTSGPTPPPSTPAPPTWALIGLAILLAASAAMLRGRARQV